MLYLVYGKRCPVYEGSAVEEFFYGIKLFNESCDVSSYPSIEMFPIIEYIPKWLAPVSLSLSLLLSQCLWYSSGQHSLRR